MNVSQKEQGGVLSFIIIGLVLTVLLVGGVLLAKQQARLARSDTGTSTTQDLSNDTSAPADETPQSDNPATGGTSSGDSSDSTGLGDNNSLPTSGPSGVDTIPSAGPANIMAGAVGLGAATAGVYMYVQSSRRVRSSALK